MAKNSFNFAYAPEWQPIEPDKSDRPLWWALGFIAVGMAVIMIVHAIASAHMGGPLI